MHDLGAQEMSHHPTASQCKNHWGASTQVGQGQAASVSWAGEGEYKIPEQRLKKSEKTEYGL